jgi:hypothetical protein
LYRSRKYKLLRVKKAKIGPPEPKNGIWGPTSVWSFRNFTWSMKKYTFGGLKGENKSSKPKNGI